MKRLLCILSTMNVGGAESFMMKLYKCLDKDKFQFDFCVNCRENFYATEILNYGGKIYYIPAKSESIIEYIRGLYSIVKNGKYYYVMRIGDNSLSAIDLLISKFAGAKRLILRSSNAKSESKKNIFLNNLFKFLSISVPNVKIAPSDLAAEYTFGKNDVHNGKVVFLHNGLDISKFTFDSNIRIEMRNTLCLEKKFVVGHIGRFSKQKNHKFILEIFESLKKKQPNAILLLIGEGDLKNDIIRLVDEKKLTKYVKFLGIRKDISHLLCAMDVFLFPSFYEGMPNTVIEAQTNGLPCLISDTITKEAAITDLVEFESLNRSCDEWSEHLLSISRKQTSSRIFAAETMKKNGYDINQCTRIFEKIVFDKF